jgi:hypothetical protein
MQYVYHSICIILHYRKIKIKEKAIKEIKESYNKRENIMEVPSQTLFKESN